MTPGQRVGSDKQSFLAAADIISALADRWWPHVEPALFGVGIQDGGAARETVAAIQGLGEQIDAGWPE